MASSSSNLLTDVLPRGVVCDVLVFLELGSLLATRVCSRACGTVAADDSLWSAIGRRRYDPTLRRRRPAEVVVPADQTEDRVAARLRELLGSASSSFQRRIVALCDHTDGSAAARVAALLCADEDRWVPPAAPVSLETFKVARGAECAKRLADTRRRIVGARRRASVAAHNAATLERQIALDLASLSAYTAGGTPAEAPVPARGILAVPQRRGAMNSAELSKVLSTCRPLLKERVYNGTLAHRHVIRTLEKYQTRRAALETMAHDLARAASVLAPSLMAQNTHLL